MESPKKDNSIIRDFMMENSKLIQVWGNDEKRKEFLCAHKEWDMLAQTTELNLTYYQYILPNGDTIIAMEHMERIYDHVEEKHIWGIDVRYYLKKKGSCFTPDSRLSISAASEHLKVAKIALMDEVKKAR